MEYNAICTKKVAIDNKGNRQDNMGRTLLEVSLQRTLVLSINAAWAGDKLDSSSLAFLLVPEIEEAKK